MKNCKKVPIIAALTAAMVLATLTGCWKDDGAGSSSGSAPEASESAPSSSPLPESIPASPSQPPVSGPPPASSVPAQGNEWEEMGALPAKAMDWGPGGPVDSLNRSQSALSYNNKYSKYNTFFIGPEGKNVYMTFDEGYEYGLTGSILDTLREKKVKAVFFVTYDFANRSGELVQRMIDEGHIVGNHSYSHKNYSTLDPKAAADDLMKMHEFVKEKFNYDMKYFRFPSGNFSEQSLAVVQKMGYRCLFWSFAYKDWIVDQQPEPAASADRIVRAACPGNIYLLHAVSTTNNQVLGEIIDRIRAEGYEWGDPGTL